MGHRLSLRLLGLLRRHGLTLLDRLLRLLSRLWLTLGHRLTLLRLLCLRVTAKVVRIRRPLSLGALWLLGRLLRSRLRLSLRHRLYLLLWRHGLTLLDRLLRLLSRLVIIKFVRVGRPLSLGTLWLNRLLHSRLLRCCRSLRSLYRLLRSNGLLHHRLLRCCRSLRSLYRRLRSNGLLNRLLHHRLLRCCRRLGSLYRLLRSNRLLNRLLHSRLGNDRCSGVVDRHRIIRQSVLNSFALNRLERYGWCIADLLHGDLSFELHGRQYRGFLFFREGCQRYGRGIGDGSDRDRPVKLHRRQYTISAFAVFGHIRKVIHVVDLIGNIHLRSGHGFLLELCEDIAVALLGSSLSGGSSSLLFGGNASLLSGTGFGSQTSGFSGLGLFFCDTSLFGGNTGFFGGLCFRSDASLFGQTGFLGGGQLLFDLFLGLTELHAIAAEGAVLTIIHDTIRAIGTIC